ncbi:hypothetical protein NITLEN_60067 [Nitrospira lenta]|uniref:Uncharacterized protein n=1 Tax=Nitrospira lenta TaxID=1436998 RepID=A0A330LAZ3_9BACT|nr:hypothetical protein NITLEN_60067 [Nitrospira lenta]
MTLHLSVGSLVRLDENFLIQAKRWSFSSGF